MTPVRLRKIALPMMLVLLGAWLLAGCVYIPMFGRTIRGTNVSRQVGDSESNKPIRLGQITRSNVIALLGKPSAVNRDNTAIAYTWTVQNGFTVWPLCFFQGSSVNGYRALVLRFQ